ncbi:aldehyde dehydrogenase family protein [Rhodoflexus caldus]|uniref:aldehyde dehydrogenase family protein n=1 Tax=Rhodoflexus caldus TaxID=2891236 RepID=UPI00202A8030|nr:aldehyde dehydrogenase family protein [Rhodoflexus caldus]
MSIFRKIFEDIHPMTQTLSVRNPRNGQYDYTIHPPDAAELAAICQRMRAAQPQWQALGVAGRVAALQQWKAASQAMLLQLIEALSVDTGRKSESVLEAQLIASSIDRWCGIATDFLSQKVEKQSSIPFIGIEQDLEPYQLVGVISPWNFPLLLSLIDTIPALLAGCAVIVKPSEVTPRFIKPLMESIAQVPALADVLVYVEGAGETGAQLVELTDIICFTGSVATGLKVYASAARHFKPVFLELGGKDPAIVTATADLDHATSSLLWGSVVNAGQSCLSIERIYVEDSVFDQFVDMLVQKTNQLRFAYPTYESGQIGPIISDKQIDIINEHLRDAREKGAKILTGPGHVETIDGGGWCFPTVLTNVSPDMKVMSEETFGPLMPVMPFHGIEDAIEKANSTVFGLSGAVFAGTNEEAMAIGRRIKGGAISINDCALTAVVHEGEKNSFKMSGIGGTRMGPSAIKRFMRQKAFLIKQQPIASPWWFDSQH